MSTRMRKQYQILWMKFALLPPRVKMLKPILPLMMGTRQARDNVMKMLLM